MLQLLCPCVYIGFNGYSAIYTITSDPSVTTITTAPTIYPTTPSMSPDKYAITFGDSEYQQGSGYGDNIGHIHFNLEVCWDM